MADEPEETTVATPEGTAGVTGQESAEQDAGIAAEEGESPADDQRYIDTLKGTVGDLGSKLSELTARYDQSQAEVAELRGRLDEQSKHISPGANSEPEPDPYALSEEQLDEFNNEPARLVALLQQERLARQEAERALKGQIGTYMDTVLDNVEERFGSVDQRLEASSPEMLPWREAIAELKKNPALAELPDATLKAIAEEKGMAPDYKFQGLAGGPRPPTPAQDKAKTVTPEQKQAIYNGFLGLTGNNKERAERMTERHLKRLGVTS